MGITNSSNKTDKKVLTLLSLFVGLVFIFSFFSIVNEPAKPVVIRSYKKTEERLPASVAAQMESSPINEETVASKLVLVTDCNQMTDTFSGEFNYLRFKGKNCSHPMVSIKNTTNGFTGALFSYGKNDFTSDLIDLNGGENQIEITYRNTEGAEFSKMIKVVRRMPTSEE